MQISQANWDVNRRSDFYSSFQDILLNFVSGLESVIIDGARNECFLIKNFSLHCILYRLEGAIKDFLDFEATSELRKYMYKQINWFACIFPKLYVLLWNPKLPSLPPLLYRCTAASFQKAKKETIEAVHLAFFTWQLYCII